jgi:hypothetical protein
MGSLSARPEDLASRSPWTPALGVVPLTQLHPLRSLVPPESPFTPPRVAPRRRPLLSWCCALLELVLLDLGTSTRPDLTVRTPPAPLETDRDFEDLRERAASTPAAGRDPPRRKRRFDPVGGPQPGVDWTPPPLGDVPTPLTLFLRPQPYSRASGASEYPGRQRSPRRPPALTGFLASSLTSRSRDPAGPWLIVSPGR